jgi:hypothetical protein
MHAQQSIKFVVRCLPSVCYWKSVSWMERGVGGILRVNQIMLSVSNWLTEVDMHLNFSWTICQRLVYCSGQGSVGVSRSFESYIIADTRKFIIILVKINFTETYVAWIKYSICKMSNVACASLQRSRSVANLNIHCTICRCNSRQGILCREQKYLRISGYVIYLFMVERSKMVTKYSTVYVTCLLPPFQQLPS